MFALTASIHSRVASIHSQLMFALMAAASTCSRLRAQTGLMPLQETQRIGKPSRISWHEIEFYEAFQFSAVCLYTLPSLSSCPKKLWKQRMAQVTKTEA
jgi:hypothetical protein